MPSRHLALRHLRRQETSSLSWLLLCPQLLVRTDVLSYLPLSLTSFYLGGTVLINSPNVFDDPLIDPALLTSKFDTYAIVKAIRNVQQFLTSDPFKNYVIGPFGDLAKAQSDSDLLSFASANGITVNHPSGTCAMAKSDCSDGVVDSSLVLKGATGLRIVDASIFVSKPRFVRYDSN